MDPEPTTYPVLPFLRSVRELTRPHHRDLTISSVTVIGLQACEVVEPLLITAILTTAIHGMTIDWSGTLLKCAGLMTLFALNGWVQIDKSERIREANTMLQHELRLTLLRKIFTLSGSFFETNNVTALHGKMASGILKVGDIVFLFGHEFLPLLAMTVLTSLVVGWYSLLYSAIIIPTMVVFFLGTIRVRSRTAAQRLARHRRDREVDGLIGTALTNIRTVLAYGQEERELAKIAAIQDQNLVSLRSEYKVYDKLEFWRKNCLGVARAACILACLFLSKGNQVRMLTDGIAIFMLTERLFRACYGIGVLYDRFTEAWDPVQEALRLRELPVTILEPENPVPLGTVRGEIALEDVCYGYDSAPERLALNHVSLTINAGETVAIVGKSGGGKSTLVKTLLRFIAPQHGRILLDGIDLGRLRIRDVRRAFGYVAQETDIFQGTVAENIGFGKPDASMEEIIAAAKLANAHDDFILELPQGYDTRVGEQGKCLSGGERQRIGIARALLCDARVIILDEATANVDVGSDAYIHRSIAGLAASGKTVIVIAHRLATVQNADRIVYLEQGRIVEVGTPTELAQANGPYARLLRIDETFDHTAGAEVTLPV